MRGLLKKYGYKITPARVAILEVFKEAKQPLNAENVSKKLKNINEATVYRNLQSLKEGGILKQVDLRKDSIYFELEEGHHHHIVCTSCNTMEDFNNQEIENLLEKVIKKSPRFKKINEHSLELFGLCVKCS